jgi:hypothetical protein
MSAGNRAQPPAPANPVLPAVIAIFPSGVVRFPEGPRPRSLRPSPLCV